MERGHRWLAVGAALALGLVARGAETLPPVPAHHFNDYAHAVAPQVAEQLDIQLADFERSSSDQLLVAIYPSMASDSSLEDFTQRLIDAWHVGQKGKNNGAVLFAFMNEHRLRIATNYGLEGVLPDAVCKRILDEVIRPRLRSGDPDGAFSEGVRAMIAAAQGEYQGNGQTVADQRRQNTLRGGGRGLILFVVFVLFAVIRSRRHVVYGRGGRGGFWGGGGPWIFPPGGGGWGGGGGSSGGGGSWGGGGFSGGGGSGGGGGASGSW